MVPLAGNHFRRGVARTATRGFQSVFLVLVGIRKPKIHDLDVHVFIKEQVLWFQIPMTDLDLVEILNACEYLVKESAGFPVLQPALFDDVVE